MINKRIKELFGTKQKFCYKFGYGYKDFAKKLRTVKNKICWLNKFLRPLNLKIEIVDVTDNEI
jgi:hypothetical protein